MKTVHDFKNSQKLFIVEHFIGMHRRVYQRMMKEECIEYIFGCVNPCLHGMDKKVCLVLC